MLHARVSTVEQIQVSDPLLSENKEFVDYFMGVWTDIINKSSEEEFYVTAEFGPQPYMMSVPGTQADVADLDDVNLKIA